MSGLSSTSHVHAVHGLGEHQDEKEFRMEDEGYSCTRALLQPEDPYKIRHRSLVFTILAMYTLFLVFVLLPNLLHHTQPFASYSYKTWGHAASKWIFIVFHIILGLALVSLTLACCSDPGYVRKEGIWADKDRVYSLASSTCKPEDIEKLNLDRFGVSENVNRWLYWLYETEPDYIPTESDIKMLKRIKMIERKAKHLNRVRYCNKCYNFKPDRSHHCRQCNACVCRMDHHCPYLDNCIGNGNHKYFMLSLFYGAMTLAIICVTSAISLGEGGPSSLDSTFWLRTIALAWLVFLSLLFIIADSVFLAFHINLTLHNLTTIEYKEKKHDIEIKNSHRFMIGYMKHDLGLYGNFCQVMGPFYLWLVPVRFESCGCVPDGYFVPKLTTQEHTELDEYAKKFLSEHSLG
mmetsp:Transcript_207/g.320  ORF Transcript_207/g.320 Transcript_207/m.320 type:complete len:405 (+) Transcript_207:92-1306(+)